MYTIIRPCSINKKICASQYLKSIIKYYHSDQVFGFKKKPNRQFKISGELLRNRCKESNFYRLVTAYRQYAHEEADIDPVSFTNNKCIRPELEVGRYCLANNDKINFNGIINTGKSEGSIQEAIEFLDKVYRNNIGAEYLHLENEEEIEWFSDKLESLPTKELSNNIKLELCKEMIKSQTFDQFLATKFPGLKRYGGEGAESTMGFFMEMFKLAAEANIEEIVLAMPHRGRMNLLTGLLNFDPKQMFYKLKGNPDFHTKYRGTGDVLSHCISSTDLHHDNKSVHVTVLYNPSHLEAVNPVSMGKTRAKQLDSKDGDYGEDLEWSEKILNIQVHGDAAYIGQGVNQECLSLCKTPHFEIGGTIHVVVNNQVGFTTPSYRGRSSKYCTDLAKIIAAPVLHVNGDHPETVLKTAALAFEYQRKFRKDIFVDVNCYRQWGHNELDDPTFTNPSLYKVIRSRKTIPDVYADKLKKDGLLSQHQQNEWIEEFSSNLNEKLKASENYKPLDTHFKKKWEGYNPADNNVTSWDTGSNIDLLTYIGTRSVKFPQDFDIHPTLLKTHVKNRITKVSEGVIIDWSTCEAFAIGSLLYEGYNVRISGQDVGRGTFSHRHAMLVDQTTNNTYIPLNNLVPNQTNFLEIANSILSEEAVLGYEYGMSIENPKNLIIWEAQFGDFFNGAQIILDVFVSSGESKWLWSSGLTILLPHGYDGAGPEHSSARIERFLQMTDSKENAVDGDDVNFEVSQPSTPAQYFHLLRRQMLRSYRKPLVIISPKSLLRLPACTSSFAEMVPGTTYMPLIGDKTIEYNKATKILITSGRHFYTLMDKRQSLGIKDTAILRLESFCPFPNLHLQEEINKFTNVKEIIWCQEEPQNMGAWTFVKPRFENLVGRKIKYCGRKTLPAPAVGVGKIHQLELADIANKPFFNKK